MKLLFVVPVAALLAACQSSDAGVSNPVASAAQSVAESPHHAPVTPTPSAGLPGEQLARVRRATARYHDLQDALDAGYEDIDVVLPNMGRHFLNKSLLDARFDPDQPELLVYSEAKGRPVLVAVEYAVPLSLSATAPEGFTGDADAWFPDQNFQLWTLHAWVWTHNPDGMFFPTNKLVP
jgi:hypothetical protein